MNINTYIYSMTGKRFFKDNAEKNMNPKEIACSKVGNILKIIFSFNVQIISKIIDTQMIFVYLYIVYCFYDTFNYSLFGLINCIIE